ncbi:MAG: threonine-phosphate decarboxylase CobD, partial [Gammaproteobacteria bacterium]|nr:threonine-phosphate decarboxylase CobD [Gammaproteobacteria bacterium]
PALSCDAWARLPEAEDGLTEAAQDYYGSTMILPVAGSQAAIQVLPQLRAPSRVGILSPSYNEHAHAWQKVGHELTSLEEHNIDEQVSQIDVLLLVNPNNPSGCRFSKEQLVQWQQQLSQRKGWLIIDEAFMDSTPEYSLASLSPKPGLIILRSLGKFFGLAGARVGFVLAEQEILDAISELLGPWTISGPSREVARLALSDQEWQAKTRLLLEQQGNRLAYLLETNGLKPTGGSSLFQWIKTDNAFELHENLAKRGILTRLFTRPASIRFGLPANETQWQRLSDALKELQ